MRVLTLMLISIFILSGCSAGAGMQATPPAPIAQTGGSAESAAPPATSSDTTPEDAAETGVPAPVSQIASDASDSPVPVVPTGAGGRFLLI